MWGNTESADTDRRCLFTFSWQNASALLPLRGFVCTVAQTWTGDGLNTSPELYIQIQTASNDVGLQFQISFDNSDCIDGCRTHVCLLQKTVCKTRWWLTITHQFLGPFGKVANSDSIFRTEGSNNTMHCRFSFFCNYIYIYFIFTYICNYLFHTGA